MIAELVQQGYFKEVTTEGRKTLILRHPVQVVIKANVLSDLKRIYPPHEETGGILYATPVGGNLVITRWKLLANTLMGSERKTGYRPYNSAFETSVAVASGYLPIRFHSHPVEIFDSTYDKQPLLFFQKTSSADRHNSYLPLNIEGYTLVLPDGLLSADNRDATDVRFYLYGGLIAPDSLQALLTSEKVYLYFAISAILIALLFNNLKKAWAIFLLSAICSIAVFSIEKRPSGVKNSDGDLVIQIY